MQKILIYADQGADRYSVESTLASFQQEGMAGSYHFQSITSEYFKSKGWEQGVALLVFPGGRDIPYHRRLQGEANRKIKDYVETGGKYLGICAGAYYASSMIEFEKGYPLEVIADRELGFFPGTAKGPAYGPGVFCYRSHNGWRIANLKDPNSSYASYYKGGCSFDHPHCSSIFTMATYSDLPGSPSAIIHCKVGEGSAVLCGVHPEYSAFHTLDHSFTQEQFEALKNVEVDRRNLFKKILSQLEL